MHANGNTNTNISPAPVNEDESEHTAAGCGQGFSSRLSGEICLRQFASDFRDIATGLFGSKASFDRSWIVWSMKIQRRPLLTRRRLYLEHEDS